MIIIPVGLGAAVWLYMATRSLINAIKLVRASADQEGVKFGTVLMMGHDPQHLAHILPILQAESELVVLGSMTEDVERAAAQHGVTVVRISTASWEPLVKVAAEASPSEWWVFLDDDAVPKPGFGRMIQGLAEGIGARVPHLIGVIPDERLPLGRALIRLAQAWIQFGLNRPRAESDRFDMWRASRYTSARVDQEVSLVPTAVVNVGAGVALSDAGVDEDSGWIARFTRVRRPAEDVIVGVLVLLLAMVPLLGVGTTFSLLTAGAMFLTAIAVAWCRDRRLLWIVPLFPISLIVVAFARFGRAVLSARISSASGAEADTRSQ